VKPTGLAGSQGLPAGFHQLLLQIGGGTNIASRLVRRLRETKLVFRL
jgi:hypothetical protein